MTKNDKIITGEKRARTPVESEDNSIISKRSRFPEDILDHNLRPLQDHEEGSRQKKLKRTGSERKVDTEEEQSSKSFTSYLQALLGGDAQL